MNNYMNYIESGIIHSANKMYFIKQFIAYAIIIFMATFPAIILKSHWYIIPVIMILTFLIGLIANITLLFKDLTIKNRLLLQTIMALEWTIQLILFLTQFYIFGFGINICIVFFVLPPIIIPLLLSIIFEQKLKKGTYKNKNINKTSTTISLGISGITGYNIAALLLNDISQQTAILVILICFSIVANLLSVGLLSIHRLYCFKKYVDTPNDFIN